MRAKRTQTRNGFCGRCGKRLVKGDVNVCADCSRDMNQTQDGEAA
jgi:DNA-directed RNA polymerase subunit RPC12/RpoP